MRIQILTNRDAIIQKAVSTILDRIQNHQSKQFVLGLSTGATVLSICEELAKVSQEQQISLKKVIVFYAGEFIGYSQFMRHRYFALLQQNVFSKVDILAQNIHSLNGNAENLEQECINYEQQIQSLGGMDLFVGSLGEGGEIAFNTAGSSLQSRTRIKKISKTSALADARFFDGNLLKVPSQALTMGLGTIFDAKEILICVYGVDKAFALKSCLETGISSTNPASIFQNHAHANFIIDKVAGRMLSSSITNIYTNSLSEDICD